VHHAAGNVSVTATAPTFDGPLLVTTIVYVSIVPAITASGASPLLHQIGRTGDDRRLVVRVVGQIGISSVARTTTVLVIVPDVPAPPRRPAQSRAGATLGQAVPDARDAVVAARA